MIEKISNYVTDTLIQGDIIKEEERNLYLYCVEGLVETVGNLFFTVLLGILFGKLIDTIIFLLIFVPVRSLAGGYHAKNGSVCFGVSILLFLSVILMAGYFQNFFEIIWSVKQYILSCLCILFFAPVDCINKRLNSEKKKQLRIWILGLLIVISMLYLCMFLYYKWEYCFVISNCMVLIATLLAIGYLENMREEKYYSDV